MTANNADPDHTSPTVDLGIHSFFSFGMENSADPDHLSPSKVLYSGPTVFSGSLLGLQTVQLVLLKLIIENKV